MCGLTQVRIRCEAQFLPLPIPRQCQALQTQPDTGRAEAQGSRGQWGSGRAQQAFLVKGPETPAVGWEDFRTWEDRWGRGSLDSKALRQDGAWHT